MSFNVARTAVGIDIGLSVTKRASNCHIDSRPPKTISCETPKDLDQLRSMVAGLTSPSVNAGYGIAIGGVLDRGQITSHRLQSQWINERPSEWLGQEAILLNDADAALIYHINRNPSVCDKNVILLTLGTGVGSAAIIAGTLIPNLELGFARLKDGRPIYDALNARELQRIAQLPEALLHLTGLLESLVDTLLSMVNGDLIILAGQGSSFIPSALERPSLQRIDDPVFAGAIGVLEIALDASIVPVPEYDGLARTSF